MSSPLRSHVVFHLTGRTAPADPTRAPLPAGLRPALLGPYRRLEDLRHDFPAVLRDDPDEYAESLTDVVDRALCALAPPGAPGEGLRRRALQVERRIRRRTMNGASGTLGTLWELEVRAAAVESGDEALWKDAARLLDVLPKQAPLIGCDTNTPAVLVKHAWRAVQREKARLARERIDRLVLRLDAILRADAARSPVAFRASRLQQTFGESHRTLFDFGAMSRLLSQPRPRGGLPVARRQRIEHVLDILRSQQFFPRDRDAGFVCATVGDALDEFLRRLPRMVDLLKALQAGELEADGRYVEDVHDPVLAALDERALSPEDLSFFPDLLVCTTAEALGPGAALLEALATGVPLKVMVQFEDILERTMPFGTMLGFGAHPTQLAITAMSAGDVFVLQTAASHLIKVRDALQRGIRHPGPALLCVYAGPAEAMLPTYLMAAAAVQSRAFPTFCYDPGSGLDLATRFTLASNPQACRDWPLEPLCYADADLQAVTESVAFTFVDFALCDPRYATHFAVVPRAHWDEGLLGAAEWLACSPADATTALPFVLAIDEADLLCRVVVDERLMRAAARCLENWHRLQELAGVHDSRVERAVAQERAAWEQRLAQVATDSTVSITAVEARSRPTEPTLATVTEAEAEPERNPEEAYVETLRCSTCNECTLAFPQIFAYNEDKQAYIKDAKAATYRQLVEAAESCQVSVIHPGKPRNLSEAGLEELLERARPFN